MPRLLRALLILSAVGLVLHLAGADVPGLLFTVLQLCFFGFLAVFLLVTVVVLVALFRGGAARALYGPGYAGRKALPPAFDDEVRRLLSQPLPDDELRRKLTELAAERPALGMLRPRRSRSRSLVHFRARRSRGEAINRFLKAYSWAGGYRTEVSRLVADTRADDAELMRRLLALANVLSDETAAALQEKFPDLLGGPFRHHLYLTGGGPGYPQLAGQAVAAGDAELIDHLAGQALAIQSTEEPDDLRETAARLAEHYLALAPDSEEFLTRSAGLLHGVQPRRVGTAAAWQDHNHLAKLFFSREPSAYLQSADAVGQLLTAPCLPVQQIALRALSGDDARAQSVAAEHLEALEKFLFRPVPRPLRLLTLAALTNAAATPPQARQVHRAVRNALEAAGDGTERERLIGQLGRLLHRWPELRGEAEQPVVYGAADDGPASSPGLSR